MLYRRGLIATLLAFALVVAACGDDDTGEPVATTAAPTTTAATTTTVAAGVDLVETADAYLSTIPQGYMNVGDITAFKDAVEASNAVLIDVRTEGEYAEGFIMDAINVPLSTLADNLDKIPTDTQVFIYCKSGHRAALAVSSLRMLGYENVLAFSPGWNGWTAAEEPVSTEAPMAETYAVPDLAPELIGAVGGFLSGMPAGFLTAGSVDDVKAAMDAGAFLVDVRTSDEFAEGYIGDAINIPLHDLAKNLDAIPTDTNVIVYCGSGYRAALATAVLHSLGYDNVKSFSGSMRAWNQAGEPVTGA